MESWLSPQSLTGIAALITAAVSAVVMWLKDRRAAPIDRQTAELATTTAITVASKTTIDSALAITERLREENQRISDDLENERSKVATWERWYSVLIAQWDAIRRGPNVPLGPKYQERDSQ